jgi:drug/metabolite transporter (DMT)-like permease
MQALTAPGQGHAAMLAFSVLVSLSFFLGHGVARDIDPGVLMTLRFALASVVLWGVLRAFGVQPVLRGSWRFLLIGGCMAAYFITMFEALRLTSAVSTAAVFTLTPLLAAGFGLLILGQRTGPWVMTALIIGASGAIWVIFRADLAALMRFEVGPGETIFAFGTLAHAAVPALLRKLYREASALQSSFATTIGALIVTALYAAPDLWSTSYASLPARVWWVLAYLAVVTTACTFFLLQFASQRLPGTKVMAYTYLVPCWVVLWEVLAYARWPSPAILLGIGGAVVALLLLLRAEAPAQKSP